MFLICYMKNAAGMWIAAFRSLESYVSPWLHLCCGSREIVANWTKHYKKSIFVCICLGCYLEHGLMLVLVRLVEQSLWDSFPSSFGKSNVNWTPILSFLLISMCMKFVILPVRPSVFGARGQHIAALFDGNWSAKSVYVGFWLNLTLTTKPKCVYYLIHMIHMTKS